MNIIKFLYLPLTFCVAMVLSENAKGQSLQSVSREDHAFFTDIASFRSDSSMARADAFVMLPYQRLSFRKQSDKYVAKYKITIIARDSLSSIVAEDSRERFIIEEDYEATLGATAKFELLQLRLALATGTYKITTTIQDLFSNETKNAYSTLVIPNYRTGGISISSILLASAVVESAERKSITPFFSEDVTELSKDGFFAFFELYHAGGIPADSVKLHYEIIGQGKKNNDSVFIKGTPIKAAVPFDKSQQFLRIAPADKLPNGIYRLKVVAGMPGGAERVLSQSEKQITIVNGLSIASLAEEQLISAIRQARYAAYPEQLATMLDAPTIDEKRRLFEEFWKELDPTPGTRRNEAFDDYYGRVEYANTNFRNYSAGWMSDMGMVYIIYGEPASRQRRIWRNDGRYLEVWTYPANQEFVFVDNTGFGDYRLTRPIGANERYRYRR